MTIPFAELPEQSGPTENAYGLDEMTRAFCGQTSLWQAFRLTILPGLPDYEYPGLRIASISPDDHSGTGSLKKVVVKYMGQAYASSGPGAWKAPQESSDTSRQTLSDQITLTRTSQQLISYKTDLSGALSELVYSSVVEASKATREQEFYAPTITFRYARDFHPKVPNYTNEAVAFLGAKDIAIVSSRTIQEEPWPALREDVAGSLGIIAGSKDVHVTTASSTINATTVRLASLSGRQQGLWFEVDETWEKVLTQQSA